MYSKFVVGHSISRYSFDLSLSPSLFILLPLSYYFSLLLSPSLLPSHPLLLANPHILVLVPTEQKEAVAEMEREGVMEGMRTVMEITEKREDKEEMLLMGVLDQMEVCSSSIFLFLLLLILLSS